MTTPEEREQMAKYGHVVLPGEDWFESLVDDVKATITEAVFTSNWALIEGYWLVGQRITEDSDKDDLSSLVQRVALGIGKSKRTLYYAVKFYERFPNLDLLPDGKASRWYHIKNKYLTDGEPVHDDAQPRESQEDDLFSGYINKCISSKSGSVTFEHQGKRFKLIELREKLVSENGSLINELIALFEPLNPSFEILYRQKPQRDALERMIKKHGDVSVRRMIVELPNIVGKKFAPVVTTPAQLENKLGDILVFVNKGGAHGKTLDLRDI